MDERRRFVARLLEELPDRSRREAKKAKRQGQSGQGVIKRQAGVDAPACLPIFPCLPPIRKALFSLLK
jgi:hypothetical protein